MSEVQTQIIEILNNVDDLDITHKQVVKRVLECIVHGYENLDGNTSEERYLIEQISFYINHISE